MEKGRMGRKEGGAGNFSSQHRSLRCQLRSVWNGGTTCLQASQVSASSAGQGLGRGEGWVTPQHELLKRDMIEPPLAFSSSMAFVMFSDHSRIVLFVSTTPNFSRLDRGASGFKELIILKESVIIFTLIPI
jgi:hypothetical protein